MRRDPIALLVGDPRCILKVYVRGRSIYDRF